MDTEPGFLKIHQGVVWSWYIYYIIKPEWLKIEEHDVEIKKAFH